MVKYLNLVVTLHWANIRKFVNRIAIDHMATSHIAIDHMATSCITIVHKITVTSVQYSSY